jgi:hypothetical protein
VSLKAQSINFATFFNIKTGPFLKLALFQLVAKAVFRQKKNIGQCFPRFPLVWKMDDVDWLLLAKGLRVLPNTPGVEGAPRAVVEEGKKLEVPKPLAPVLAP